MIRIHAGKYKGQSLIRPNIATTRETSGMVREAVFNSLSTIKGNVLDLFAGSGSYGFTALSNGASLVHFIDSNSIVVDSLKETIKKFKITEGVRVFKTDYKLFLKTNKIVYDYIFLDPPFDFKEYNDLLNLVSNYTNESSTIILEQDKRTEVIEEFNEFTLLRNKVYGSKRILIYVNK